ncbi:TPA: hypothetical protein MFL84_002950 [Klebsiella pneumoniae]|uniref:hypothetical protein n=1 Tax=Klebsiella variicola TaxID=244366 RepID=UPI0031B73683|nr:hypothetical protein [Klebsiella pneumoniae]HBW8644664.1 hypothetical protein [Klebsiella pneumoniae]
MDAYISYQSLLAYRESADWAFLGMLAAWVSASLSILTLLVAVYTLNTWRRQEALKLKLNLKQAILEFETDLENMPESWTIVELNAGRMVVEQLNPSRNLSNGHVLLFYKLKDLQKSFNTTSKCWVMCDGLFKNEISNHWSEFVIQYKSYSRRGGDKEELHSKLQGLYTKMKLFK